jgi:DNA polymerase III epsilon subunit-like protein
MKILFFDTETNGLPVNPQAKMQELQNWPRVIQLAWLLASSDGEVLNQGERLITPDCWEIPKEEFWISKNFTTERSKKEGVWLRQALTEFLKDQAECDLMVAHNLAFDYPVLGAEMLRYQMRGKKVEKICTMESSTLFCMIPFKGQRAYLSKKEGKFKYPTLQELYKVLFKKEFEHAHTAGGDTAALKDCFFELLKRGVIEIPNFT